MAALSMLKKTQRDFQTFITSILFSQLSLSAAHAECEYPRAHVEKPKQKCKLFLMGMSPIYDNKIWLHNWMPLALKKQQ